MAITNASLLKIFLTREKYETFHEYVKPEWLTYEAEEIFKALGLYYKAHPEADVLNIDDFATWFHVVLNPELPRSKHSEYKAILARLQETEELAVGPVLNKLHGDFIKGRILESLNGDLDKEELLAILEECNDVCLPLAEFIDDYVAFDAHKIVTAVDRTGGFQWRMGCLNRALGPLIQGDFVLAAGYVDSGKTSFAISEAGFMAQQLTEGKVLWLNNEEIETRVQMKLMKSILNAKWTKIAANLEQATKSYAKKLNGDKDRILIYNISGWSIKKVRRLCQKVKPKLIVIDQVDNIKGGSKEGPEHLRLGGIYEEVRNIAKQIAPVLGISQTDASVRYLDLKTNETRFSRVIDMSQLRGSKMDKPGALDAIITIGQDENFRNKRYISTPKNKLGNEEEINEWRHLRGYEVDFDGALCRFTDTFNQ